MINKNKILQTVRSKIHRKRNEIANTDVSPLERKLTGAIVIGDIGLITIGKNVSFGGNVLLYGNAEITIGDDTCIGINAVFHTSTHDYSEHPVWVHRIDRPICIGRHVWIGTSALILPGVIVEDFSVVGAGSVVNANVPKGAIVGGNPARILKYRESSIYEAKPLIEDVGESRVMKQGFKANFCK